MNAISANALSEPSLGGHPIILKNRIAIITGASSGLGKRLALDLARHKMSLVLASRNADALARLSAQVERAGSSVLVQPTDVTDAAQCTVLIENAIKTFQSVDFLLLNAGISMWARLDEITDTSILRKLMETNYFGAVNCIHPALPHLRQSRGMIVAISSLQAILGVPSHTGYAASKHALKGFLEALELELGGQVHILNVMPSWIRGTQLRANAFQGDGTRTGSSRQHNKYSVELGKCSAQIVRAMVKRRRQIFIPAKLGALPWLRLIAPNWLKAQIKRAVAGQVREKE